MKNCIIVHALGNTANEYWYPWLKKQIEGKGFICYTPTMPGLDNMSYRTWANEMDKIKSEMNEDTVVIGHSTGSIFLAHYLIENNLKVSKYIGVVSFNEANHNGEHEDWDKINESFFVNNLEDLKKYAKERICFYSPTDIYDFKKLDDFANKVDAEKVIIQNAGHFTAVTGYGEKFEEILKYID
ncbi:MAG: alpha/beta hydrolase [Clostridia bacterium]|nr:alpha/beta hydrolase [Clostridia bacterium]